jgi:hypothetical protein
MKGAARRCPPRARPSQMSGDGCEWMKWQPSPYLRRTVECPAAARDPSGGERLALGL